VSFQDYFVVTGYTFFFLGLFLLVIMVVLLLLQNLTLPRCLDKHLYNENYFTPQELSMFSNFPLSLLKTLAYIRLISFPNSLRKRFGNATARDKISMVDLFLSHLTMAVFAVGTLIVLNFLIAMTLNYLRLEVFGIG